MIKDEFGVVLRFNAGYDMSNNTGLQLVLTPPSGSTNALTRTKATTPAVTLGASDVETSEGTFTANEYVEYTTASGEIDEAGSWTARLTYTESGVQLISELVTFVVGE